MSLAAQFGFDVEGVRAVEVDVVVLRGCEVRRVGPKSRSCSARADSSPRNGPTATSPQRTPGPPPKPRSPNEDSVLQLQPRFRSHQPRRRVRSARGPAPQGSPCPIADRSDPRSGKPGATPTSGSHTTAEQDHENNQIRSVATPTPTSLARCRPVAPFYVNGLAPHERLRPVRCSSSSRESQGLAPPVIGEQAAGAGLPPGRAWSSSPGPGKEYRRGRCRPGR